MGKARSQAKNKRTFHGNRFTSKDAGGAAKLSTASSSKLKDVTAPPLVSKDDEQFCGNRIIDIEILAGIISTLSCPLCHSSDLILTEKTKFGLCSHLQMNCSECEFNKEFFTSKKTGHSAEINIRLVYGMRQIGRAHASAYKLCATLNLPPPPRPNAYREHEKKQMTATSKVAHESMIMAADEVRMIKKSVSDDCVPCAVSVDGTWQRRGHTSLNGVVSAISIDTGKILDIEVMSSYCRTCKKLKHMENDASYQSAKADHSCNCNYEGSAGTMEVIGAKRIFERSKRLRKLCYSEYFGDGDSKAFLEVKDTYGKNSVTKHECIGHIQKRVGTRLRTLKKKVRGLGGKGKLTDAFIDRLQNYYGIAIRSNVGDFNGMQQAVIAAFHHCASSAAMPMHGQCLLGIDSWCAYQRAQAANKKFVDKNAGLPKDVIKQVRPVYMELCSKELLTKCLRGKTQNQNESFNGKLWQTVPKEVFVGLQTMRCGAYDSVINFNDGFKGSINVLNMLSIKDVGLYTLKGYQNLDRKRIAMSRYQSTPTAQKRRKILRAVRKKKSCCVENKEGFTYKAGGF